MIVGDSTGWLWIVGDSDSVTESVTVSGSWVTVTVVSQECGWLGGSEGDGAVTGEFW